MIILKIINTTSTWYISMVHKYISSSRPGPLAFRQTGMLKLIPFRHNFFMNEKKTFRREIKGRQKSTQKGKKCAASR